MYELKTNTAVRIPVGPLVDPTDGKTAETALTVADLSVQIYQCKNDGTAVVRTQFAPTASGGNNDMALVSSSTDGMYDLELTAAQLNFLGNARITFYDVDGFLVHWIDILVVSAAYFDWKYGTTKPEMHLADDAITAAKYDESTAFPLKSADTGATAVARTGADSDTLKTLSDQMDASYSRLGAPAGASVSADVAAVKSETTAIKAKTDNLPADPADQSAVEAAITAATSPLATAAALDVVGNYVDTEVAAIKAVTDKLDSAVELDGEVYRFTTNALEQAPSCSGLDAAGVRAAIGLASANLDTQLDALPTAAENADAVWDEVLDTAHEVAGSASVLLQASGAAGDPMSVAVPGAYAEGTAGYVIGHLESSGSGSVYWPYTVTDSATGNPIEGVTVSVSTDIAGSVVVASGTTNASGVVNFNLDPGTYYLWLSKTGYTFTNPDTEVIA